MSEKDGKIDINKINREIERSILEQANREGRFGKSAVFEDKKKKADKDACRKFDKRNVQDD